MIEFFVFIKNRLKYFPACPVRREQREKGNPGDFLLSFYFCMEKNIFSY